MNLPIVDIFEKPYTFYEIRNATLEEILSAQEFAGISSTYIKTPKKVISSHVEAAIHILEQLDSALEHYIADFLGNNLNYQQWKKSMPSITPNPLSNYQKRYPSYDAVAVDAAINKVGHTLSEGQCLFHGGFWPTEKSTFTTDKPLSTSFSPQVALMNALRSGKAYDSNCVHLFVLIAKNPQTKVFSYKQLGTNLGHEKEVLFAKGAKLTLLNKFDITNQFKVVTTDSALREFTKNVTASVLVVNVS